MTYQTIYSLGSRCQNSEILKHYKLREFSGFFDFMNTFKIENINHMIKDDFCELLKPENNVTLKCEQATYEPETGKLLPTSFRTSNKFYNHDYNDVHTAIYPHHDLNEEKTRNHFITCYNRFKKLINYSVLFNYTFNTWENNPTKVQLEEMVESLKTVHKFKNFKICFIAVIFDHDSSFKKSYSSEYYDVWSLKIQPSSFTGGLFNNQIDNENYINIIKSYDISEQRITKEQIDQS